MERSREPTPHQVLQILYYKNDIWLKNAQGEENRPLGIFMDKESEFLSFHTIYCGQTRADYKERTTPVSGWGETILNDLPVAVFDLDAVVITCAERWRQIQGIRLLNSRTVGDVHESCGNKSKLYCIIHNEWFEKHDKPTFRLTYYRK